MAAKLDLKLGKKAKFYHCCCYKQRALKKFQGLPYYPVLLLLEWLLDGKGVEIRVFWCFNKTSVKFGEGQLKSTLIYQINVPVQLPNFAKKTLINVWWIFLTIENDFDWLTWFLYDSGIKSINQNHFHWSKIFTKHWLRFFSKNPAIVLVCRFK